jgi:hypothetical protein
MSTKRYENNNTDSKTEKVIGVVTDCLKLNIRQRPYKDSEVVAIAVCLDELSIDIEASTNDWYAVCTVAGIEGFCMKKFVAVRQ